MEVENITSTYIPSQLPDRTVPVENNVDTKKENIENTQQAETTEPVNINNNTIDIIA